VSGAAALPLSPLAGLFGFALLPGWYLWFLGGLAAAYLAVAELVKRAFHRHFAAP